MNILSLAVFLLAFSKAMPGQSLNQSGTQHTEQLQLLTDRTLYATGENIRFSAMLSGKPANPAEESKVLYCELITADAARVAGGKYLFSDHQCNAFITIPSEIITGVYYLRAYTKYMRNKGPQTYSYVLLKIINPYKKEVLNGKRSSQPLVDSNLFLTQSADIELFKISTDKNSYKTREQVNLSISGKDDLMKGIKELRLSVIPDESYHPIPVPVPEVNQSATANLYYPETRGISITGRLFDKKTQLPLPFTLVNLSIIGEKDFMAVRTDTTGGFYFSLPEINGNRDVFLCAENKADITPVIYVDNDFCPVEIKIHAPAFSLSEKEEATAYNIAVNQQVAKLFGSDSILPVKSTDTATASFYGQPSEVLLIDKYVQLPTLEEYFNELPGLVKIRKRQGKSYFKFANTESEMVIYDPLVLIDWVAVDNMEKILAIPPTSVSQIELVNAPYVKGDITYGGIVSIISRNGDFAGIDLPTSGVFINYSFLSPVRPNGNVQISSDKQPDPRNTILWEPSVIPDVDGNYSIRFDTPDTPGNYLVLLRGIGGNDEIVTWRTYFEVK